MTRCAYWLGGSRRWHCTSTLACRPPKTRSACSTVSPQRPTLLALSANSPFWQGLDSGFASARTVIFQAFPRTGPPRYFADYGDYVEAIDALIASGAIRDPSFLWWDVRLQPALGTVEVRVMDAQSTVQEVAPSGRVDPVARTTSSSRGDRASARRARGSRREPVPGRSRRDGRPADRPDRPALVPVRETLEALLVECHQHAVALGCDAALDGCSIWRPLQAPIVSVRLPPGPGVSTIWSRGSPSGSWRQDRLPANAGFRSVNKYDTPTERSGTCAAGSHTPAPPSS